MLKIFGNNIEDDSVRSIDEIVDESNKLSDFVNDVVKNFCALHNIDTSNVAIKIKTEKISTVSFFPNVKKKYCMRVVNEEGVSVNKLDVVGFAIRRSDYPSITKEKLYELIELILSEDATKDDIVNFVREVSNYIYNLALCGRREVGRPVSYNRSNYVVVPSHVNGMHLWNKLEFEYFYPGTKGYMFRIRGVNTKDSEFVKKGLDLTKINLKQYNYIVMPIDYEKLPEYYIVDASEIVKNIWLDIVSSIVSEL